MTRLRRSSVVLLAAVAVLGFGHSAVVAQEGELVEFVFHSGALEGNLIDDPADRSVIVYLPPSYHENTQQRYPTVYLLHGSVGSPTRWTGRGGAFYQDFSIKDAMDGLVAEGVAAEMIFVMPDANNRFGGSWYLSSETIGDYE